MMKRAVEKFNTNVAALLPGSAKSLEMRDGLASSSAFSALMNRTVYYLETNGYCIDDVFVKPIAESSSQTGIFAKRPIKKGNVIVPVPLYARRRDGSCSDTTAEAERSPEQHCFSHKDSSLVLCPLSTAAFIQVSSGDTGSAGEVNAALKWGSRTNFKSIHKLSVDDILKVSKRRRRCDGKHHEIREQHSHRFYISLIP